MMAMHAIDVFNTPNQNSNCFTREQNMCLPHKHLMKRYFLEQETALLPCPQWSL